jgi:hypothetical protein
MMGFLGFALILCACSYALNTFLEMKAEIVRMAVENRELVFRNSILKRREDIFRPQGVNWGSVEKASRYFGTPEDVLYAIRRTENGGAAVEMGYHGKSWAVVSLHERGLIGLDDWQYCEASRRYTALAWGFVREKENWKAFTDYASRTYAGGTEARWKAHAKSVRHFTKEIQVGQNPEAPKQAGMGGVAK